jgi:hypothetical protein
MFPLNGSVTRHTRFPPPDSAGFGSPASPVLSRRSDARSPSHSALFRSPSGTTDCCNSRGSGELLLAGSSSVLMPVPQSSAFDSHSWRRRDLPGSSATPLANMLCSSTPADRMHQASKTYPMLPSAQLTASAPRSVTFRGSITRPARSLSTLHGSDYSDSNTAQDSLPTGGQPYWGRTLTCWVASGGFHSVSSTHIAFPSSKLFLAHQPP